MTRADHLLKGAQIDGLRLGPNQISRGTYSGPAHSIPFSEIVV